MDLRGLKIVVDCAEGASYYTSIEALKELGGEIVAIHNNTQFAPTEQAPAISELASISPEIRVSQPTMMVGLCEGASYYTSIEALKELGGEIVAIHNSPDGTNINANCGSTHMQELQARVVYEKAQIGLAFDGDADRLLAVDEQGNIVDARLSSIPADPR